MTKKAKKELLYYGPPTTYETVRGVILGLSVAAAKSKFTYQLSKSEFAWACQGGFDQIASALGDDVAFFKTDRNPKSIIINGSKEQYQQARSMLVTQGKTLELDNMTLSPRQQEAETCTICWTTAEDPVTLVCGHLYCAECLEELCRSSSSDNGDFSIICRGMNDTCKRVLSLTEIEHYLSSKAFEEVLRVSFSSYIRRRADVYSYCPTPDCGFIYTRTETASTTSTCLNCMAVTCRSCRAQHGSTSCADYMYERDGCEEAFNTYMRENDGKNCPRCTTHIQKVSRETRHRFNNCVITNSLII